MKPKLSPKSSVYASSWYFRHACTVRRRLLNEPQVLKFAYDNQPLGFSLTESYGDKTHAVNIGLTGADSVPYSANIELRSTECTIFVLRDYWYDENQRGSYHRNR